ncbi:hypothetical protein ACEZDB_27015 [Streptacidiphilus sp. N1-3]|uniref:Integral membrane protein n=1 Tax=Streptacidiphilus alkalitolerans TaxID=3342712 RepID=A0ABV6X7M8_9ACTN
MRAQPRVRLRGQDVARGLVLAGGLALVGFGVAGFLGEPYLNGHRLQVLLWAAGAILLHDGVWAPVLLVAGAVLVRVVPARVRGPVLVGLITAAGLTAVGFPAVLREDQHNGNPTLLPLPYLRNWLLLLGLVVVAVAVWVGVAAAVARRRARPKKQTKKQPWKRLEK